MQPLVQVAHHNIALLFVNYAKTQGLSIALEQEAEQYIIYVADADYDQAKAMFEEFARQPHAQKYQQAAWQSGQVVEVNSAEPSLLTVFKRQFLSHAGPFTLIIFGLCWLVYVLSVLGWGNQIFSALRFYTSLSIEDFLANPIRLIGPALFHFSLLHIVFNTMWWWQMGGAIEKSMGKMELIQVFFFTAILSNVGQFLETGNNFGGLSGVVYGVIGYVWLAGVLAPEKGMSVSKPLMGFLIFWLVLGFVDMLPVNVANTAHLLGLLSGLFVAWLRFNRISKQPQ